jgi:hypothetical protein
MTELPLMRGMKADDAPISRSLSKESGGVAARNYRLHAGNAPPAATRK